jgi:multidrug resistance efflux pump
VASTLAFAFILLSGSSIQSGVHGQVDSGQQEPLTAVGNIELISRYQVALETSGRVNEIAVEVGDQVKKGDLLIALDTANLEKAVERAELNLEDARIALEDLTKDPEESDIAVGEANLLLAQENLEVVEEGPTEEEMQASENGVAAAWARYNKLREGPTDAQINQARASLRQAEVNLQQAQREYDKVAWLPESAASEAADNLQRSTISYESAKANFDEASKPAEPADLLSALSSAQSAEDSLNRLKLKPTRAELAEAKARVTAAEATLAQLNKGPTDAELATSELRTRRAVLDLEEARENLHNARVVAPVAGTVLELLVELGQPGGAGSIVAIVADTRDIKLIVNVEQQDIRHVQIGQEADISTYAYPEHLCKGVVEKIAPISETGTGFVSFPVTIRLIDDVPATVRPGMTANAVFATAAESPAEDGEADQQSND